MTTKNATNLFSYEKFSTSLQNYCKHVINWNHLDQPMYCIETRNDSDYQTYGQTSTPYRSWQWLFFIMNTFCDALTFIVWHFFYSISFSQPTSHLTSSCQVLQNCCFGYCANFEFVVCGVFTLWQFLFSLCIRPLVRLCFQQMNLLKREKTTFFSAKHSNESRVLVQPLLTHGERFWLPR